MHLQTMLIEPFSVRENPPFLVFLLLPSIEMFDPLTVMIGSELIHCGYLLLVYSR